MKQILTLGVLLAALLPELHAETGQLASARAVSHVDVAKTADGKWTSMATRTLSDLPAVQPDTSLGKFGGGPKAEGVPASKFFQTARIKGRWWLIDPEGRLFIHQGVASVRPVESPAARKALELKFGTSDKWAEATASLLHQHGFNGTGGWTSDALQPSSNKLVHTRILNFMSSYGRKRGGLSTKPGHAGYPGDCPFIFDKEFPGFSDELAKDLASGKDDPWLLGYFTDNELPWSLKMLDLYLKLPAADQGNVAAQKWLAEKRGHAGKPTGITDAERSAFLDYAADTYFSIVSAAIRHHDPNHLVLGSRFHGSAVKLPELFKAAGRHVDIVSVNYYHAWSPDRKLMDSWAADAKKPFIISEWYAKGVDSGFANRSGAGWLVKTQSDRGRFYQNFTLGLLESKTCVGWHWFRYADNDPDEKGTDPSNRDSNKGIITNRYEAYQPLLDAMREINLRSYGLIRHFDATPTPGR